MVLFALVPLAVRADETDPEPPGGKALLGKLAGKWTVTKMVTKGAERKPPAGFTYTFEKDRVTYDLGGRLNRVMKCEPDPKRRDVLTMTPEGSKVANRYFFKIEKDTLFLALDRSNDPRAKPDFTGNTGQVLVLAKEKK
jgi:uncharacterized protein (TIGR03067 family)